MARERSGETARPLPHESTPGLSVAELRQIITLMQSGDIQEISIEREADALKLHLRKPAADAALALDGEWETPSAAPTSAGSETDALVPVTAPFVGRFHAGAKTGARLLPKAGDTVKQGQVLGAIETLNVLSEVEAAETGRIAKVKVKDGQAVQYGQVLLLIEPVQS